MVNIENEEAVGCVGEWANAFGLGPSITCQENLTPLLFPCGSAVAAFAQTMQCHAKKLFFSRTRLANGMRGNQKREEAMPHCCYGGAIISSGNPGCDAVNIQDLL